MPELEPYTPCSKGWTATIVNSVIIRKIRELPVGYTYQLQEGDEVEPNFIAYLTLGNANYGWIVMIYNSFLDIRELSYSFGTKEIKVPDRIALMQLLSEDINN